MIQKYNLIHTIMYKILCELKIYNILISDNILRKIRFLRYID
jgi:hypothetical protein